VLKAIPKAFFFDREYVIKRLGAARVKVLSKAGAFIRRSAQTSMRYRRGASQPGTPPHAHKESGALLRSLLFFSYDESTDSVVVGPVAVRKAEAPRLNEFGGTIKRTYGPAKGKVVRYPKRAFMAPALKKEMSGGKLAALFKNSLTK
jgi:hypothetical protein